jgi:hypothetical protein
MPQRWDCLIFWLRSIKGQPFEKTVREVKAAIGYGFYMLWNKPNLAR